jgi:hypothetical protein
MGKRRRSMPLSLPRRWIGDLVHFGRQVPLVPFERRMNLAAVAEARRLSPAPPGWCAIFVKAYAVVAQRRPELRRAYLPFPVPRLYEHPFNVATVTVEREYGGEKAVFPTPVRKPEKMALRELHDLLHRCKAGPAEQFEPYRRLIGVSRLPWPLRRLLWGVGLNVSGDLRARLFGTFCVSVTAGAGAAALLLYAPVTTILWYSPFDEAGRLDVRLAFDHRVMDGMTIAHALAELEEVMHEVIVPELRQPADVLPTRAAG